MKIFLSIILSVLSLPSNAEDEPIKFDAMGGKFQILYEADIEANGGLSCEFYAKPNELDQNWSPSVVIAASDKERHNTTQVVYSPTSGDHYFDIRTLDGPQSYSYVSSFLSLRNNDKPVRMSMFWRDDGTVVYRAEDNDHQQGVGYILNPDQKFDLLRVTASGVKGSISCFPNTF